MTVLRQASEAKGMRSPLHGKRGQMLIGLLVVVIVIIIIAWLIGIARRECGSNVDCATNQYCGSDHQCHEMPVITETVYRNSLLAPSIIIGLAIIAGFWLHGYLRGGTGRPPRKRSLPPEPRRSRMRIHDWDEQK